MTEKINTLIIGGGQAGLALSYYLLQRGHPHLIIEQASQPAEAWRNHRWDSFTLVTPNSATLLPGAEYQGDDPNGYMHREDVVQYLEAYIDLYKMPIRYNVRATSVTRPDNTFRVETTAGSFETEQVVIATGTYQTPKIPADAQNIAPAFHQLHTDAYRNPAALPPGGILVIGGGQSGCQIAEELYQSGRQVYLSTGKAARAPRRYRGKDIVTWLTLTGFFDATVDTLKSPRDKFESNPLDTGKDGGHALNLHQFARDGVTLLGHFQSASGSTVLFAPDLYTNLQYADQREADIVKMIDGFIARTGLDAPPETLPTPLRDGYDTPVLTELDLAARGITIIIWAIGYNYDYSWVRFPIFDADGYPIQTRGVTSVPGLYFLGLHWLHKRKSTILLGVGEDAAYLADQIT